MLAYILMIAAILLALFLGCLVHAGFFYTLRIRTSVPYSTPSRVAYKVYRGPYKNAGAGFNDIGKFAPSLKKFGIYYDDPAKVRSLRTRTVSSGGGGGVRSLVNQTTPFGPAWRMIAKFTLPAPPPPPKRYHHILHYVGQIKIIFRIYVNKPQCSLVPYPFVDEDKTIMSSS